LLQNFKANTVGGESPQLIGDDMRITNQGVLLDEVYDVQESLAFSGSVAIIDMQGACIQIPDHEMEKIVTKYSLLKSRRMTPKPQNTDDYFSTNYNSLFVNEVKNNE
jgi:hypothetical protein